MSARRALAFLLLAGSLLSWLPASDVPRLIVRWEEVVLGRYSEMRFVILLSTTLLLWLVAYGLLASLRVGARGAAFRVAAMLLAVTGVAVAADLLTRSAREPRYIERTLAPEAAGEPEVRERRRRPDRVWHPLETDLPVRARSYPNAPPGHPARKLTVTTDHRGYRNPSSDEATEIVAVGDSFTEGAHVSDGEAWPALLGERLGRRVYNLGMSGAGTPEYVGALRSHGPELAPKLVILMVYEGNDFKSARQLDEPGRAREPRGFRFKDSPLVKAFRRVVVGGLARVDADAPVDMGPLAWMPLAIPEGPDARYYAFRPKRLTRLHVDPSSFPDSKAWRSNAALIRLFREECDRLGARMVLAYAPSEPHVVLPLVEDRVSPAALAAFAGYNRDNLEVSPDRFGHEIQAKLGDLERIVRGFAEREGIEFVSPTVALRESAARGRQVYFTYDQHWTPAGHEMVADVLHAHLADALP